MVDALALHSDRLIMRYNLSGISRMTVGVPCTSQ